MNSPNFGAALKNRSQKSQNSQISSQNFHNFHSSINNPANNQSIIFIQAYLMLQKNVKKLSHSLNKILFKQKRCFLNIIQRNSYEFKKNEKIDQQKNYSNKHVNNKQIISKIHANPQIPQQLEQIALKNIKQILNKYSWTVKFHMLCKLNEAFSRIKSFRTQNQQFIQSDQYIKSSKTYKEKSQNNNVRQKIKQNSNYNQSQIYLQSQHLQREMRQNQVQEENFIKKMTELLDSHQKYLLQDSLTTRNKKTNKNR